MAMKKAAKKSTAKKAAKKTVKKATKKAAAKKTVKKAAKKKPDDDAAVDVRGNALFDWCRAFLGGFGLSAGPNPPLSEEGTEALEDLARLAMAEAESDGDEEDEAAFAEIEEFVRVASLLLHGDCALGPRHRKRLH